LLPIFGRRCVMNHEGRDLIRRVQDAVDLGATRVEEIHKSIADLPLAILQEIGLLKETAREVQRVQDRALGAIYRTIREVNERVATFASELMTRAAPRRARPGHAGGQRHAAA
jgi:hypothetical protein